MYWDRVKHMVYDWLLRVYLSALVLIGLFTGLISGEMSFMLIIPGIGLALLLLGVLIQKILKRRRIARSGIDIVDKMSGEDFEQFLLELFKKDGYEGYLTSVTSDYGADIILKRNDRKIAVQAKRWKKVVGVKSVQEIIGAIKYYDADKGMVITNSVFTENAYKLAEANGVELWDRKELINFMFKNKDKEIEQRAMQNASEQVSAGYTCPSCGSPLVEKRGKYGVFWGCSSFPKCKYTADLR